MENTAAVRKTWISSAHRGVAVGKMHENTLSAFALAAEKGADMIETDARASRDGILIANHDPVVRGFDIDGRPVEYVVAETDASVLTRVILAPEDPRGPQYVPTLEQVLHLAYFTGMQVNIDLKEGAKNALPIAQTVRAMGLRGRTVYATNGAGTETILAILRLDPGARFIDTPKNYTAEKLYPVPDYPARCFAYTSDFSDENIARIRASGCMLASISLNAENAADGLRHHPDMAEYPHTSDFAAIDRMILSQTAVL